MSRANPEIAPTNNLDANYASLVDDLTACHSPASPDPGALDLDDSDLAMMALPAAPSSDPLPLPTESHEDERPVIATAKTGCGGHCANHERDSLRQQLTRAALREARENLKQVRADLRAQLDGRNTLVADQGLRIDDLLKQVYDRDTLIKVHSERIDDLIGQRVKLLDDLKAKDGALKAALTEIAALESFRDSFLDILEERDARLAEAQREQDRLHQRLREQERQRAEDQNRIDALLDNIQQKPNDTVTFTAEDRIAWWFVKTAIKALLAANNCALTTAEIDDAAEDGYRLANALKRARAKVLTEADSSDYFDTFRSTHQ